MHHVCNWFQIILAYCKWLYVLVKYIYNYVTFIESRPLGQMFAHSTNSGAYFKNAR